MLNISFPNNKKMILITFIMLFSVSVSAQRRPPQPRPQPAQAPADQQGPAGPQQNQPNDVETALRDLISNLNIEPINGAETSAPDVDEPAVQLGKQLFFSKNLGGEQSVACVSCHHPVFGGADNLSLSVGVNAVDINQQSTPDLLGLGRFHGESENNLPIVARNAPSIFNLVLKRNMFWDGRVETLRNGTIVTPDSPRDLQGRRLADPNLPQSATLADAQSRFPVTSEAEMRGDFLPGIDNQSLRDALSKRFDNSDLNFITTWPQAFEQAFGNQDVNFNRIAESIGEYEQSMLFINNPWQAYLNGNSDALTAQQKQGAVLFFSPPQQGGAGCGACHNGPDLSDSRFHLVAFPQFGPGSGDNSGQGDNDDFGREQVTNDEADRYHFRTPSLLNVAVTAPYGHTGSYTNLEQVVRHYIDPARSLDQLFSAQNGQPFVQGAAGSAPFCRIPQVAEILQKNGVACEQLYPDAYDNSAAAIQRLQQAQNGQIDARAPLAGNIRLNALQVSQIVAFLNALTDPCVTSRECLAPWIIDANDEAAFPDDQPLIGFDKNATAL